VFKNFTFRFAIDTAQVAEGDSFVSVIPDVSNTLAGISYISSDTLTKNQFFTDNFKRINFRNTLRNGIYSFDALILINSQDTLIKNVFNLTVNIDFIKHLKYDTNIIALASRQNFQSDTPTFFGTKPVTFFLQTQPDMPAISINNVKGVINIAESVLPGNYKLSVTAKNPKGFSSFSEIINFTVGGSLNTSADAISFGEKIVPIIISNCGKCHLTYREYHTAFSQADNIYDRITRKVGDPKKMPQAITLTNLEIEAVKKWIDTGKNP